MFFILGIQPDLFLPKSLQVVYITGFSDRVYLEFITEGNDFFGGQSANGNCYFRVSSKIKAASFITL